MISGHTKPKGSEDPASPRGHAKGRRRKPESDKDKAPERIAGREQRWQRFMQYAKKKGTRS